jgi:exopolyphosphatase / guanosine-5'-triphosphate,3'-diphosphate pyrophosphatase
MGSNAIRFMIAETTDSGHQTLESYRLPVRLGEAVFRTGRIPEAAIADTVDAFRRFRATCERMGVKRTRAIATSAMRDASNRDVLVHRVQEAAGFDIDVISGTQEAYLLKLGVETKIDLSKGRSLLVDLGGGSVEVVVVEDGNVASANSYRLGALRMLEAFRDSDPSMFVDLMQQHLKGLNHRIKEHLEGGKIDRYAAVGGNIDSLADLVSSRIGANQQDQVDACRLSELKQAVLELATLTPEQRIATYGFRPDRADTILPAGLVYLHLGKLAKAKHVLVPRTGIKEGLLVEVAKVHRESFAAEDHVDVVLASCRAMGRRFHYETQHAESVLRLARQLFDQTRELHNLSEHARVLLDAAALLHDIGVTVNNDGHHKHSQYLIESTDLVGLGSYERHLVAMLARYHRKANPNREHADFAALCRRDRSMIEQLTSLLRLADAIDRQHAAVVESITATIREQSLELHATLAEGQSTRLTLEAKAVAAKGALFEKVFGYKPTLIAP